jgi:hypothetical protein
MASRGASRDGVSQRIDDGVSSSWCQSTSHGTVQIVDEPTQALLNSFDLSMPGHTLLLPRNEGRNVSDPKLHKVDILASAGINVATTPPEVASQVGPPAAAMLAYSNQTQIC